MRNPRLFVPCNLVLYCAENKKINELKLLISLKFLHNDYLKREKLDIKVLSKCFGKGDTRTINKYINSLIKLNWLGYDRNTDAILIRGWNRILSDLRLTNKKWVLTVPPHLNCFNAYLLSVVIELKVKSFKFFHERVSKNRVNGYLGKSANVEDVRYAGLAITGPMASQISTGYPITFYGISNEKLAQIFKKSKAWVSLAKKQARMEKLLFVKKRFMPFDGYDKQLGIKQNLAQGYGEYASRFRTVSDPKNSTKVILMAQLHDELKSLLHFKY